MKRIAWTPERTAELLALSAMMPHKAVAAKLGLTLSQVENRVTRAKSDLASERKTVDSLSSALGHGGARLKPDAFSSSVVPAAPTTGQSAAVHTRSSNYLIISDLQIPYHAVGGLDFCKRVRREFSVPLENVLCVGDEFDLYAFSRYDKSPDAPHTPSQEIAACREEIARWAAAFPQMRICRSNHGGRLAKAAARGGLPKEVIAPYREILGVPEGWRYSDHWIVDATRERFRVEHGHRKPGGHSGLRIRPLFRGMSTAWGHEHAEAATLHMETGEKSVWALRVGSLITREPVPAFDYNSDDASRPVGSVGVVLDGGRLPLVVKM